MCKVRLPEYELFVAQVLGIKSMYVYVCTTHGQIMLFRVQTHFLSAYFFERRLLPYGHSMSECGVLMG